MKINIDVSVGELLDKISILEIKYSKIEDKSKLKNITKELASLNAVAKQTLSKYENLKKRLQELKEINLILWGVEDEIREKESKREFDNEFIRLARDVYYTNDKRFEVKNLINQELGSYIKEEKHYKKYS